MKKIGVWFHIHDWRLTPQTENKGRNRLDLSCPVSDNPLYNKPAAKEKKKVQFIYTFPDPLKKKIAIITILSIFDYFIFTYYPEKIQVEECWWIIIPCFTHDQKTERDGY